MNSDEAKRLVEINRHPAKRRMRLLVAAVALHEGTIGQLAAFAGWRTEEARAVISAEPDLFAFGEPATIFGERKETFRLLDEDAALAELRALDQAHPELAELPAVD